MTFESLVQSAEHISTKLKNKKVKDHNKVFVSIYLESGVPKFSLRLNDIDNRVKNLTLKELLLLVFEINKSNSYRTPGGLSLSHGSVEVFWPEGKGMSVIYDKFKREYLSANSFLRQELLISSCEKWEGDLKKRISK
jgi:hypothetical protein